MSGFQLECHECGQNYPEDRARYVCDPCSALQGEGEPTRGVLRVVLDSLPESLPDTALNDPSFLAQILPVARAESLAPLAVGATPLLPVPRLRDELGMPALWVKDDTRNPSGSTKDRASLLVVAKAREYGYDTVAAASTGNAATALAAVCAAAGLRAVVFVPASAPPAKLTQMQSYGATLYAVEGSYDEAFDLSLAACERFGWYNRNTALNPFTIEGKKTAAIEIGVQLSEDGPVDAVVVPVGDGVILSGVAKGFRDLVRMGVVDRVPRLIAAQAAGSPAIFRAWNHPERRLIPVPDASSVADSLTVGAPRNALLCLEDIAESGGSVVEVPEEDVLGAIGRLARATGVFAEPAAATALGGLLVAREQGLVGADERTVLLITGTGLKDVGAAERTLPAPRRIPPSLSAVDG